MLHRTVLHVTVVLRGVFFCQCWERNITYVYYILYTIYIMYLYVYSEKNINLTCMWTSWRIITWEKLFGWSADLSLFVHSKSYVWFGSSSNGTKPRYFCHSVWSAVKVKQFKHIHRCSCGKKLRTEVFVITSSLVFGKASYSLAFKLTVGSESFQNVAASVQYIL